MKYDYIVVGAGLGGLSAGLNLVNHDKKVLILEKNSLPGGLATTFRRGRFEFDTGVFDLFDYGDEEHVGTLYELFKEYHVEQDVVVVPFNERVKVLDTNEDYQINGNIEEFFALLEQQKPGSIESLKQFLKIVKEVHEAIKNINEEEVLESEYPNFYKYLDMSTLEALNDLKLSKDIIHKLSFLWIYLGSPIHKLSFIDFAEFMYKVIFKKRAIIHSKNINFVLNMEKAYRKKKGKIYYRSEVVNIKLKEDEVEVRTKDKVYRAKQVICDLMPRYVLKDLITEEIGQKNKLENARTLGANSLIVYLGLNKDKDFLDLKSYKYYHFDSLNSVENIKNMNHLNHNTWQAIVPNVVNEEASPKNTTILVLKADYYDLDFDKVTRENYYQVKEDLANCLIEKFEKAFNIDIKEYIEEIAIATPFTIKRYTNNVNGSIMGYMPKGYDNAIHRILAYEDEKVENIHFVGGSSIFGGGADNAIKSGYYITNEVMKREEEDGE